MRALALAVLAACAPTPVAPVTIEPLDASGDVAFVPAPREAGAEPHDVMNALRTLHVVAEAWRANHADECPTVQRLIDERELAASASPNDPWNRPYKIVCEEGDTIVISSGPDRREGTPDDIRFPEAERSR